MSCYRAPNTYKVQFLKDYKSLLHSICSKDRRVIIGLDHNLDLLKNNTHRNTQEFLETDLSNKLLPCISKPTRITHSTATLIDNTFCSVELHGSYKSYILIDDISDHMPCLSILSDVFPTKMSVETITRHRLTEKAITKMKDHLELLDWSNLVSSDWNCETNYVTVHNILQETLDEYAPVRTMKLKRKKLSDPWLIKGLINCQCKQKLLYKRSIKLQDPRRYHE